MSLDAEALPDDVATAGVAVATPGLWGRAVSSPWLRIVAGLVYLGVFIWAADVYGLPTDRIAVVLWMLGALVAINLGRPWRSQLIMLRDWGILVLMLFAYDYSRGAADSLGRPVHVEGPRDIDRFLFFGHDPNVVLQRHFYEWDAVRWYDIAGSFIYMSHFVLPIALAVILWARNHDDFVRYTRRWATILFAGVATFILYPAAPPWMADGYYHAIDPIVRGTSRGWTHLGLDTVSQVVERGREVTNPVAAMPSLHAAFALMVVLWFFPGRSWWVRSLLLLFPISMLVTLVYFGEHYVADGLLGWAIVLASFGFWGWYEKRAERRAAATEAPEPGLDESPDEAESVAGSTR